MKLNVPDMSCGHCKKTIATALQDADPLADLNFDMDARQVTIDTGLSDEKVIDVLTASGYPATPA